MTFDRAHPPEVHIVLALEQPPRVRIVCDNEDQERRIRFWATHTPAVWELVDGALQLAAEWGRDERRAA